MIYDILPTRKRRKHGENIRNHYSGFSIQLLPNMSKMTTPPPFFLFCVLLQVRTDLTNQSTLPISFSKLCRKVYKIPQSICLHADLSPSFEIPPPPKRICLFSSSPRSHHPSTRSINVFRLMFALSTKGLRGPSSAEIGRGGIGGTGGSGGTGSANSFTRTLFSWMGAVGGGGNHGWRTLSLSDESLSNCFTWCAMAVVPRLRLRVLTAGGFPAGKARGALTAAPV